MFFADYYFERTELKRTNYFLPFTLKPGINSNPILNLLNISIKIKSPFFSKKKLIHQFAYLSVLLLQDFLPHIYSLPSLLNQ